MNNMFCFQCQEAFNNTGCTKGGMCGKSPKVSAIQDLIIYNLKGLAQVVQCSLDSDIVVERDVYHLVTESLFKTITNANFDDEDLYRTVKEIVDTKKDLLKNIDCERSLPDWVTWDYTDLEKDLKEAEGLGVLSEKDEDIRSLKELVTYGLKGIAAYLSHANVLGEESDDIDKFLVEALGQLTKDLSKEELIDLVMSTGAQGVAVMALLDSANTKNFGDPEISDVSIEPRSNPGILISGHDLEDMKMLLEQTEGTGVDVYTHSEMLPANYYPEFKKYDHLVGNYGGAWHTQRADFETFNGPILMTTNCIVPVKDSYKDRIFTTGAAGYPDVEHIEGDETGYKDFSEIIDLAKDCEAPEKIESGSIVGGFAHSQVLALADQVVEAVQSGDIKKFVVMAGCDGRQPGRNYYTEFAKELPDDTVILTAGCAKYRYNKLNLGDINGIPRVLDAGQCNDSYSLAVIAMKLQEVFELEDINDLPIVYNIAWYEQKAVIVLLALLSLGVKNIHLGPTLPAFLSPNVVDILVENFGIGGISTVEEDIEMMIG